MTLNDASLFTALRAAFPADLDQIAITVWDQEGQPAYRWRDLERGSAMLANLFDDLGLQPGERIALQVEKSVEALMVWLACLRSGLVLVPLNPAYQAGELTHFLSDAEPRMLICAPEAFGRHSSLAFQAGVDWVFTLGQERQGTLLERAAFHSDQHAALPRQANDAAAILYTSGTTGRSKGALLSHGNLLSNARTLLSVWGWQRSDVLVHALPIFHVHGLFVACHCALLGGSAMRWFQRFDPLAVCTALPGATVFMGVPTLYTRLLGCPAFGSETLGTMRLFISGSAPLQAETFDAFRARTGLTILERYGMSETGMLTSNPLLGARRRGSVGPALPGVSVRIDAPDASGVGGVEVQGPNVFGGYWRRPELNTSEFSADGFFRTGDMGRLAADGHLELVGRAKDLIITGGLNVYPAEVELQLNALPGVQESAVIGLPHPDLGEAVTAVVVGAAAESALLTALRAQLAGFKCPKRILFAPELPRNAMGKVQKNLLRQQHQGLYV
ncbi:malonyl-CoA/methylmalonyl-CoA synthetase [Inhella inkyongensis]|uniref:Malonyl-CoA/methylmalonyl-CoA synthetase n=1 Tax=Inhella inkyongensis TaxID=392593 RepID=A0A840S318_9BURK|nr:AMP-binding protein [Inhella inkyongensis]MBB5203234.1 malonyl-CoA/methylmalonyl-CoA synthetase [Inhella inkyongensis]